MRTMIPDLTPEIEFKTSRSGGKGGQHVNKVSSKVELIFRPANSLLLSEPLRLIILERLSEKLTKDGAIHLVSQTERSQLRNKHIAIHRLYELLESCLVVRKQRKATTIPRAVLEQRLIAKKRKSALKRSRRVDE